MMKLTSTAFFFVVVIFAAIIHDTSAVAVSSNGVLPDEEFTVNCFNLGNCSYGYNRCTRIQNECNRLCVWVGGRQNGSCLRNNNRSCRQYPSGSECFSAGCIWRNNRCNDPTSVPVRCSDYGSRTRCVNNGCFWNRNNGTCRRNNNRSCISIANRNGCLREGCVWRNSSCNNPTSNQPRPPVRDGTCIGANDRTNACGLNQFCYTKGNCSNNARGECVTRPRTFADCSNRGIFSISPTSAGNACNSNRFYNSECMAAISGENMSRSNQEGLTESLQQQETDEYSEAEEE